MKKAKGKIPNYYWDSPVFISWLQGMKDRTTEEQRGIEQVRREIDSGNAQVIISSLVRVEVLNAKLSEEAETAFIAFFSRSNVVEIAADPFVANKARAMRDYYKKDDPDKKTLGSMDAVHLATAILYMVDEFHTFDDKNKPHLGLLRLNGDVAGHKLTIIKPGRGRPLSLGLGTEDVDAKARREQAG